MRDHRHEDPKTAPGEGDTAKLRQCAPSSSSSWSVFLRPLRFFSGTPSAAATAAVTRPRPLPCFPLSGLADAEKSSPSPALTLSAWISVSSNLRSSSSD